MGLNVAATAFETWRERAEELKRMRAIMAKVAGRWLHQDLGMALEMWRSNVEERVHNRRYRQSSQTPAHLRDIRGADVARGAVQRAAQRVDAMEAPRPRRRVPGSSMPPRSTRAPRR